MPSQRGPVPVPLKDGDRDLTQQILDTLAAKESLKSTEDFQNVPQVEIKAALDRLASRSMIEYQQLTADHVVLEKEGQTILDTGSHEYRVWDAVRSKGRIGLKELPVCVIVQVW